MQPTACKGRVSSTGKWICNGSTHIAFTQEPYQHKEQIKALTGELVYDTNNTKASPEQASCSEKILNNEVNSHHTTWDSIVNRGARPTFINAIRKEKKPLYMSDQRHII